MIRHESIGKRSSKRVEVEAGRRKKERWRKRELAKNKGRGYKRILEQARSAHD